MMTPLQLEDELETVLQRMIAFNYAVDGALEGYASLQHQSAIQLLGRDTLEHAQRAVDCYRALRKKEFAINAD